MADNDTPVVTVDTTPAPANPTPSVLVNADDLNQQLLVAQARLKALEEAVRNNEFEKVLRAHNVNPDFDDYIKFKLKWNEITDFNNAITEFVTNNPTVLLNVTTGGADTTVTTNPDPDANPNPLLDYKEKNNL